MSQRTRRHIGLCFVVLLWFFNASSAYASDCSDPVDCKNTIAGWVMIIVAIAVVTILVAVFWPEIAVLYEATEGSLILGEGATLATEATEIFSTVKPPQPPADPTQPPGEGWQWRGKGSIGGEKGGWYNPESGESLHPDLNHPEPIGPHWDYRAPDRTFWRIFPDGTIRPK